MAQLLRLCERGVVTGGDADELLSALQVVTRTRGVVIAQEFTFAGWRCTANLTPEWMAAHTRHRDQDPSDLLLRHRPYATPYFVERDTPNEHRHTPLHDAMHGHGFSDVAIARLYSPFRSDLMIALYRFDDAPIFDESDRELLRLVLPAVGRGLSSQRALAALNAPADESLSDALPKLGGHFFLSLPGGAVQWSATARRVLRERLALDGPGWRRAEAMVRAATMRFLRSAEGARSQRIAGDLRLELAIVPPEKDEQQRILGWLIDDREPAGSAPAEALLSPRQREIAHAVARGAAVAEVAERFGISVETVRTHLRAIYRRLGVRDRRALVRVLDS